MYDKRAKWPQGEFAVDTRRRTPFGRVQVGDDDTSWSPATTHCSVLPSAQA
jgi:hypothetical protein